MTKVVTYYRWRDRLYRIHVWTGLAAAVWFLLMAVTGILINHQESLGLLDAEVSNRYLPGHYSVDSYAETTRLNVIIADLHSGQILGGAGRWLSDLVAVLLMVSLLSGYFSNRMKKKLQAASTRQLRDEAVPAVSADPQWEPSASGRDVNAATPPQRPSGRHVPAQ